MAIYTHSVLVGFRFASTSITENKCGRAAVAVVGKQQQRLPMVICTFDGRAAPWRWSKPIRKTTSKKAISGCQTRRLRRELHSRLSRVGDCTFETTIGCFVMTS